jgi:predicted negative regulator of RcsB-dependent stress response
MSKDTGLSSPVEGYLLEGLEAAKQCGDDVLRVRLVNHLVYLYRKQGRFDRFYNLYQGERNTLRGTALAELLIGTIPRLIEIDSPGEAWTCIKEARALYRHHHNTGGEAYTWRLAAQLYWKQENLGMAEECYAKEETLRRQALKENASEIIYLKETLRSIFWFFAKTGQLSKAQAVCHRYGEIAEPDDVELPRMWSRVATILLERNAYDQALDHAVHITRLYRAIPNLGGQAWAMRLQGDILSAQGELAAAMARYEEAIALRRQAGKPYRTAPTLAHVAQFCAGTLGDPARARRYYELARDEYRRAGSPDADEMARQAEALAHF